MPTSQRPDIAMRLLVSGSCAVQLREDAERKRHVAGGGASSVDRGGGEHFDVETPGSLGTVVSSTTYLGKGRYW